MKTDFLPPHLRKYIVEQHYEKYTPIDQAVWRYILRQLRSYLSKHAHECYLEGLRKTGINVDRIPRIEEISQKLQDFGWRALPVSGFIPPAAFMELQSLGVLPIASDMRTLQHLLYTPAPDIVHEAAGHAPILIHPEFSNYLRQYAQVAKKAILTKEDIDLYEAIRELSDLKENPNSTEQEIQTAEARLEHISKNITLISEASELSRMNWWTAEYGLIGDINSPKIFGAGLLSSVGEAKWCLSPKVKKIPLSVDCIKVGYDITEPQPQLFVTPDFETLSVVLEEMAAQMAFRVGGLKGLNKALEARSVNTAELNSGIQISGQIVEVIKDNNEVPVYLRLQGPSQLCYQDLELPGHDKRYHEHGFGTPLGELKKFPGRCPSSLNESEWSQLSAEPGMLTTLEYNSGVIVRGVVQERTLRDDKTIILTLNEAKAEYQGRILFEPSWGTYDIAIGTTVSSVFGGPADREAFGETDDFIAKRVVVPKYSEKQIQLHLLYGNVRRMRDDRLDGNLLEEKLAPLLADLEMNFPEDWLLRLEALELLKVRAPQSTLLREIEAQLQSIQKKDAATHDMIQDGLALVGEL